MRLNSLPGYYEFISDFDYWDTLSEEEASWLYSFQFEFYAGGSKRLEKLGLRSEGITRNDRTGRDLFTQWRRYGFEEDGSIPILDEREEKPGGPFIISHSRYTPATYQPSNESPEDALIELLDRGYTWAQKGE